MGEYVEEVPIGVPSSVAKGMLAQLLGQPVEHLYGVMVVGYLVNPDDPEDESEGRFSFVGNISDEHIEDYLLAAVSQMNNAVRLQEIADMVPDDIGGLFDE